MGPGQPEREPSLGGGLALQGVRLERSGRKVLDGVDLAVRAGTLTALLGANGAGKSTLLAVLAGDLAPQAGRATLDGRPLERLGAGGLARCRAVLPQQSGLAFDLPVEEVVAMGAYPFEALSAPEVDALVDEALRLAGAADLRARRYETLSGGEQQRVQCARVLAQGLAARRGADAGYLLLDEPTASLDPRHQHSLLRTLAGLARERAFGILVVLHDINLAARWCDRLVFLAGGRVAADGPAGQVLEPAVLRAVYGMPARIVQDGGRKAVLFGD